MPRPSFALYRSSDAHIISGFNIWLRLITGYFALADGGHGSPVSWLDPDGARRLTEPAPSASLRLSHFTGFRWLDSHIVRGPRLTVCSPSESSPGSETSLSGCSATTTRSACSSP